MTEDNTDNRDQSTEDQTTPANSDRSSNPDPTTPAAGINDDTRQQIYEQTAQVIGEQLGFGLSATEAVDLIAVEKAGLSEAEWAARRDVGQSTIRGNISQAREKINTSRVDAEITATEDTVAVTVTGRDGETHDLPFGRETQVMGNGSVELQFVYEAFSSIHGYYTNENGHEFEATLWHDGRPANSFEEFDHFDEFGTPESKADVILWESQQRAEINE